MRILAIHAHPDDIEFLMGGTLALLAPAHELTLATFTNGDCGSATHTREEIGRIRPAEAAAAAALLGARYVCLGCHDLEVDFRDELRRETAELLRRVAPDVVFTASPQDYMVDHEMASALVRDACFSAPVPLYATGRPEAAPPLAKVPYLLYADPIELTDYFGRPVEPMFVVDVSLTMDTKTAMLACHASQREWLRKHHGIDAYIETMKHWSAARGALIGAPYAEGFRQHLGHSFPRGDILAALLGDKTRRLQP
ncbi:MAG TPA: PIG-L family deacetylase [Planctomycetota bacterium]|nr:MAG: Mycothiol S-conjugate amidase [Planctomycetes bacterium ADurb.Bin069]HNR99803.1 PIG-L family deacetylase [Planctomycetota bacterium]HNU26964.1 PIG-L family deacetylase [Planctomycetota bacterium]HOE29862.1 PIG-L family deacetylase [Planctomycetota bacterium]HOE86899.1 PIG-L family deacetylase [Planctomycetota bacterium]